MLNTLEGFAVDVSVKDGIPHVSVRFADGRLIFQTSELSITGLERMAAVFTHASKMAFDELERYHLLQVNKNKGDMGVQILNSAPR